MSNTMAAQKYPLPVPLVSSRWGPQVQVARAMQMANESWSNELQYVSKNGVGVRGGRVPPWRGHAWPGMKVSSFSSYCVSLCMYKMKGHWLQRACLQPTAKLMTCKRLWNKLCRSGTSKEGCWCYLLTMYPTSHRGGERRALRNNKQ